MTDTKLYLLSKKIHRICVLIITALTFFMAGTGSYLKFTFVSTLFSFIDFGLVRTIHSNLSPLFSFVLAVMVITGIYMYVFPYVRRK
ncbi:hypothetical protein HGA88_02545 [Candidatus Roizmanbacteria bacterium]|nr:hypothetical protein [Candidatus Roizmanbacteria bacterium]